MTTLLRIIIGLLAGILGMLAGWAGLAFLVISLAGHDQDGGIAMGAFFQIGPIGGVIGFILGVWLFIKFGIVRQKSLPPDPQKPATKQPDAASPPVRTRISRPFAIVVLLVVAALSYEGWYELIRSPYLTHGFMTLDLQFRFPASTVLPTDADDVHIDVTEGGDRHAMVSLGNPWHGHDGDRPGILASAAFSYKASNRIVTLELPGIPVQTWQLDLGSDPDPMPGYSPFKLSNGLKGTAIEMSYRLTADN